MTSSMQDVTQVLAAAMLAAVALGSAPIHGEPVARDVEPARWAGQTASGEQVWTTSEPDSRRPIAELKSAAEKGEAKAQYELGVLHLRGHSVPHDIAKAVDLFEKAAQQRYPSAERELGIIYTGSREPDVPRNAELAVKWTRSAADAGDRVAMSNLAYMYQRGLGLPRDNAAAGQWARKSADLGWAPAETLVGKLYSLGPAWQFSDGTEVSHTKAVTWYRKAAAQHFPEAQYNLGVAYLNGTGVEKDVNEARRLFALAAAQGDAAALSNLGMMFATGTAGPRDQAQAVKFFRQAAELGDKSARYNLAVCYTQGMGVPADPVRALAWARLADEDGHANARRLQTVLEQKLSSVQIEAAGKLSDEFRRLGVAAARAREEIR